MSRDDDDKLQCVCVCVCVVSVSVGMDEHLLRGSHGNSYCTVSEGSDSDGGGGRYMMFVSR